MSNIFGVFVFKQNIRPSPGRHAEGSRAWIFALCLGLSLTTLAGPARATNGDMRCNQPPDVSFTEPLIGKMVHVATSCAGYSQVSRCQPAGN